MIFIMIKVMIIIISIFLNVDKLIIIKCLFFWEDLVVFFVKGDEIR